MSCSGIKLYISFLRSLIIDPKTVLQISHMLPLHHSKDRQFDKVKVVGSACNFNPYWRYLDVILLLCCSQ
jgi:hypothetical protein